MHVDAVACAAKGELDAMMDQPLAMGAGAGANLDRDLLVSQRQRLMEKWRDAKR